MAEPTAPIPKRDEYAPRPRWVTALIVIGLVLVVLLVILMLVGGGHGPGRHG